MGRVPTSQGSSGHRRRDSPHAGAWRWASQGTAQVEEGQGGAGEQVELPFHTSRVATPRGSWGPWTVGCVSARGLVAPGHPGREVALGTCLAGKMKQQRHRWGGALREGGPLPWAESEASGKQTPRSLVPVRARRCKARGGDVGGGCWNNRNLFPPDPGGWTSESLGARCWQSWGLLGPLPAAFPQ